MGRRFDPDRAHQFTFDAKLNTLCYPRVMGKAKSKEYENYRVSSAIFLTGFLTTVIVSPTFNYDPINLVKVMILTIGTFFAIGIILANRGLYNLNSKRLIPIYAFGISIVIPLFFAEAPLNQQLWGIFGRNTGALTLLTSSLLIFASALVIDSKSLARLVRTIFLLNAFLVSYCLVQIAGLDPVPWSQYAPFATLGNVNFLSAILGMFSVVLFVHVVYSSELVVTKLIFTIVMAINIFVMLKTDSIQGPIIFLVGGSFAVLSFAWSKRRRITLTLTLLILLPVSTGGIFGLLNQGPLSSIVYQSSNVFRADYMSAAWKTFESNFLTGVGHDSFDGWYRTERGFISAFRTSPLRTTNSAHNIYLDMAANGGIFLFASYLGIVFITLFLALNHIKKSKKLDVSYVSILGAWIAFIVQSAISINQIGVSVWGWIFTGVVLGLSVGETNDSDSPKNIFGSDRFKNQRVIKNKARMLSAKSITFALVFALIGLLATLPPLLADSRYKTAMTARNLDELIRVAEMPGVTAFHLSTMIDLARRNNLEPPAIELSTKLISNFPREFFGWNVRMTFTTLADDLRREAYLRAKEIDPHFYCADVDPSEAFLTEFDRLPLSKKYELVRWWGLIPFTENQLPSNADWLVKLYPQVKQKASTFCGS